MSDSNPVKLNPVELSPPPEIDPVIKRQIREQLDARNRSFRGIELILKAHNRTLKRFDESQAEKSQLESQAQSLHEEIVLLKHKSTRNVSSIVDNENFREQIADKERRIAELTSEVCDLLRNQTQGSQHEVELHRKTVQMESQLKTREENLSILSSKCMQLEIENERLLREQIEQDKRCQVMNDEHSATLMELKFTEEQLATKKVELQTLVGRWLKEKEVIAESLNTMNTQSKREQENDSRVRAELLAAAESREVDDTQGPSYLDRHFGGVSHVPSGVDAVKNDAHAADISCCAFNNDGSAFATGSHDRTVKIWDPSCVSTKLINGQSTVTCMEYTLQDHLTCGFGDGQIRIYNATTSRPQHALNNHTDRIYSVVLLSNGTTLFSASKDHTLKMWDIKRGCQVGSLLCDATCYSLCCFDESCLVSAHFDRTIRVRDPRNGLKSDGLEFQTKHTSAITHVCINPASTSIVLTASKDHTLREFDVRTMKELKSFDCTGFNVDRTSGCQACYSPDGCYVAWGASNGEVTIWNSDTGSVKTKLSDDKHTASVLSCAWSPRGSGLVTVGKGKSVLIWR